MDIKQKRIEKFNKLKTHAWYGKQFAKLKESEVALCNDWLNEFGDSDNYGKDVNRIFVSNFTDRKTKSNSKNALIWELLSLLVKVEGS